MCSKPESLGQAVKAGFGGPWVKKSVRAWKSRFLYPAKKKERGESTSEERE